MKLFLLTLHKSRCVTSFLLAQWPDGNFCLKYTETFLEKIRKQFLGSCVTSVLLNVQD